VPQAAQSLMGQGGIPNIGGGFAGQIRSIRLEHVWVEAFVDYVPSRGAVNRNPTRGCRWMRASSNTGTHREWISGQCPREC